MFFSLNSSWMPEFPLETYSCWILSREVVRNQLSVCVASECVLFVNLGRVALRREPLSLGWILALPIHLLAHDDYFVSGKGQFVAGWIGELSRHSGQPASHCAVSSSTYIPVAMQLTAAHTYQYTYQ